MFKKQQHILWAGSDQAFEKFVTATAKFSLMTPVEAGIILNEDHHDQPNQDDGPQSRLVQIQDDVALLNIAGVLTNQNNWWNEYAGLVSYDEVRAACHEIVALGAKQALLFFDTPGGSVAGVMDAADAIRGLGKVVPTTGFSDSQCTSAGYWLLSATKKRYAAPVAMLGSIGVIAKHFSYAEAYKQEGIEPTVLRAGEFKALSTPEEALSDKARGMIEDHLAYMYGIFVENVAANLNISYPVAEKMAQGREFIGQQAVDAGLIDAVASFDEIYSKLVHKANNSGGQNMNKRFTNLSAAMAAASAGMTQEDLQTPPVPAPAPDPAAPTAEGATAVDVVTEGDNSTEPTVEGAPAPSTPETPETPESNTDVLAVLQGQLLAAQEEKIDLKVEVKSMEQKLASFESAVAPLKEIVAASLNTMLVALGGVKDDTLANLDPADLVGRYTGTVESFKSQYKVGGVAVPETDDTKAEGTKQSLSAVERAQLNSVKSKHKEV